MSWFKAKQRSQAQVTAAGAGVETKSGRGREAEERARRFLESKGLALAATNYRVARGPSRPAGEVDLVMRAPDGTLVFVEVRARRDASFGGAAASIGATKQRRIRRAAEHYLRGLATWPPCRFDVIAIDGERIEWLQAAFDHA
jgi:putative endonuclease